MACYLIAGYVRDARLNPFLYLSSIETVQHAAHRLGRPVHNSGFPCEFRELREIGRHLDALVKR